MEGKQQCKLANQGTHLSWYTRFLHVSAALSSDCGGDEAAQAAHESNAHDAWEKARLAGMPPPAAYSHLVDLSFAAAVEAQTKQESDLANGIGDSLVSLDDPVISGKVPWLPKWCVLDTKLAAAKKTVDAAIENLSSDTALANENADENRIAIASIEEIKVGDGDKEKPRSTLWFGDIPGEFATNKRVTELIFPFLPATMPTPYIRKVIKQGYRDRPAKPVDAAAAIQSHTEQAPVDTEEGSGLGSSSGSKEKKPWLGYAFVTFRDNAEATEALQLFDGVELAESWKPRVQWAADQHQTRVNEGRRLGNRLAPGAQPPVGEQLFPSLLHGHELVAALERHRRIAGVRLRPGIDPWVVAEVSKAFYRASPRQVTHAAGCPLPARMVDALLSELKQTRWPPVHHRTGMQADHYLVLYRGKRNDGFEELYTLLEQLLEWAEPAYGCNRIAVTKDFQGSPHIDASDVTYQYAVSLGDFTEGGELCVEGDSPDEVFVVNTHDRLARVDGRYVHWVRGHGGGERYSIIFFATNPLSATERLRPFHADFVPHGIKDEVA